MVKIKNLLLWLLAYAAVAAGAWYFWAAPLTETTSSSYNWYPYQLITPLILLAVLFLRKRPGIAGRLLAAWTVWGWTNHLLATLGVFAPGGVYDQVWSLETSGPQLILGFWAINFVILAWIWEFFKPKSEFNLNWPMIPICLPLLVIPFFYPGTGPGLSSPLYGPCDTEVILLSMGVALLFFPSVTVLLGTGFFAMIFFSHELPAFLGVWPTWCEVFGHGALTLKRLFSGAAPNWVYGDYLAWSVSIVAGILLIRRYLRKNNLGVGWIFKTYWKLFAAALVLALAILAVK